MSVRSQNDATDQSPRKLAKAWAHRTIIAPRVAVRMKKTPPRSLADFSNLLLVVGTSGACHHHVPCGLAQSMCRAGFSASIKKRILNRYPVNQFGFYHGKSLPSGRTHRAIQHFISFVGRSPRLAGIDALEATGVMSVIALNVVRRNAAIPGCSVQTGSAWFTLEMTRGDP